MAGTEKAPKEGVAPLALSDPAIVRKIAPGPGNAKENPVLSGINEKRNEKNEASPDARAGGRSERAERLEIEEMKFNERTPTTGEMLVWLDTYDDIFSDFDPRPYAQRELSDDFLKELGRRYMENTKGGLEVHFHIPAQAREARLEGIIRKRLREHFAHELHELRAQIKERKGQGLRYLAIGFGLLLVDVLINYVQIDALTVKIASILITPAGWFALWTGMERVVQVPYKLEHLRSFYERFSKCNYSFVTHDAEK